MIAMLGAIFVTSLLGSLHCAGMCGGLVALAVTPGRMTSNPSTRRGAVARGAGLHAAYHGGRLAGYMILGAVFGGLGAALQRSGALVGLQRTAGPLAGGLIIVLAAMGLLRALGVRIPAVHGRGILGSRLARPHAAAQRWSALPRSAAIGALSGLLPCGWLYMFLIASAGTGRVGTGALVMAAFWAGSVPILILVAAGVQTFGRLLGRHVPVLMSLALLAIGIWTAGARTGMAAVSPADLAVPRVLEASGGTGPLPGIAPEQAPCCRNHGH
jgi:sulfite exporter TauE/SafE